MEIKRDILNRLKTWKINTNRKPLILQGARQVGKTWLLKHFGEQEFESTEFKGALTENYVLESLIQQFEGTPRYWTSGAQAEVDFLIQYENEIIPIEVKADMNVRSKSLSYYRKEFSPRLSIRYSLKYLSYSNGLVNIPLFMADHTQKIISIIKKVK